MRLTLSVSSLANCKHTDKQTVSKHKVKGYKTHHCMMKTEVSHRVQSGWRNWKKASGVLCDRRMKVKINGKVCKTIVRPAMVNGAKTWAVKKTHEKKMEVAEMKMLRWMCGVTRFGQDQKREDQRKNESGRDFKKGPRTLDAMVRACDEKRVMGIEVQGSRRRGRPKRWADCVKDDSREKGLSGEEVYDRAAWRRLSSHVDLT